MPGILDRAMSHMSHSLAPPSAVVRGLRRELGLTQLELAERVGMSRRTIVRIERGDVHPRHASRVLLAAALKCKPSELQGER